jgi:predicted O-linked N-acetylglucosamine transferase (SPINDLY family)
MTSSIEADCLLANNLLQEDKFFEALGIYNRLIAQDPSNVRVWVGIGMVMVHTEQWGQAGETFKLALQLDPVNLYALYGMSLVLSQQGETQAACDMIDRACQVAPDNWQIHQWRAHVHAVAAGADPVCTLELYKEWGRRFADPLTDQAEPLPALTPEQKNPRRRLRVGYVSGDLRQHPVAFFMEPVFANHNPQEVEVFVYSTGRRDEFTQRIAAHVPNWFDVFPLKSYELCTLIRSHQIDVLVDLSGHTVGHRLFTFARRAAPAQVTWMGFMGPLGMKAMDYRLTDFFLSPPGAERHSSEQLFRLHQMFCYIPPPASPEVAELPMLAQGHPTLISLNNSRKVTNEMLLVWREILMRRTDAHLILMAKEFDQELAERQMIPRLEKLGLPQERVHISRQLQLGDFMTLGGLADVALDTFPISGGTTTMHTLWMGLPVVALAGHDETSGYTASILRGLGYDDWVANDIEVYIGKALALLDDPRRLQEHRRTVRERMRASPVMNYAERTAELEKAYRLMWLNHLLGELRYLDTQCDLEAAMQEVEARQRQVAGPAGARVGQP